MSKILLIDSDNEILENMKTYLSWYGFEIETMNNTQEAIARLASGRYALLICDIFTTPVNGYVLCKLIRQSDDPRLAGQEIMLVGPENPEDEKYLYLEEDNIRFMNKYENAGAWRDKINIILREKRTG